MITELSPLLHRVSTQVRPEDLLLQKGAWVYFSPKWPGTWDWCSGKLFEVSEEPVVVPYAASYTLPGGDYKKVDLSNSTAGLKLYPEEQGVLYECAVGFKPGDYVTHIYVPAEKYVFHLGESTMYPDVTDAARLYLGAKRPGDSPHTAPTLRLYFIKNAPAVYLWPYVLGSVTYEKVTIEFSLNKCKLTQVAGSAEEMIKRAKKIAYYSELVGY